MAQIVYLSGANAGPDPLSDETLILCAASPALSRGVFGKISVSQLIDGWRCTLIMPLAHRIASLIDQA
jgi:hypothetical protein